MSELETASFHRSKRDREDEDEDLAELFGEMDKNKQTSVLEKAAPLPPPLAPTSSAGVVSGSPNSNTNVSSPQSAMGFKAPRMKIPMKAPVNPSSAPSSKPASGLGAPVVKAGTSVGNGISARPPLMAAPKTPLSSLTGVTPSPSGMPPRSFSSATLTTKPQLGGQTSGPRSAPVTPASGVPKTPGSTFSSHLSLSSSSFPSFGAKPATTGESFSSKLSKPLAKALVTPGEGQEPKHKWEDPSILNKALEIAQAIISKESNNELVSDSIKKLCGFFRDPLNVELRADVLSGKKTAEQIAMAPDIELMNPQDREQELEARKTREINQNLNMLKHSKSIVTTLFTCPKCKKSRCSMIHRQTRSGDEPMTAFLTCMECGNVFRRQA